ncbi:apicoplast ribosomal protein L11, putative [Plasmodium berghei ANKA]|uniref:Apicoplast ribosomal protein L11, putative n=2 Tax=Plasmodium berghei TaxID=5821 RepID=A0A509ATA6_PLABA|nr:open reading frame 129 [Plasmodium berghei]VUC58748.1 apicoplast ribosomal protein L11, putative [Plasmodium berghei ANKA]
MILLLYKYKISIKNKGSNKVNLMSILNYKFKSYNINLNLLNKKINEYINKYKLNVFIIYIYSNKTFKITYNYTLFNLYKKYNKLNNIYLIIYKLLLYKKFQLLFYNINQLFYIITNNLIKSFNITL